MEIFRIVKKGDGYDTFDITLGYADNRVDAGYMQHQAQIFNPEADIKIEKIETFNYLIRMP